MLSADDNPSVQYRKLGPKNRLKKLNENREFETFDASIDLWTSHDCKTPVSLVLNLQGCKFKNIEDEELEVELLLENGDADRFVNWIKENKEKYSPSQNTEKYNQSDFAHFVQELKNENSPLADILQFYAESWENDLKNSKIENQKNDNERENSVAFSPR